jgi:hypothetical protein
VVFCVPAFLQLEESEHVFTSRRTATVVVGLTAAWALAACSGSSNPDASKAATSASPSVQVSPAVPSATAPSSPAPNIAAGIVLSACNSGTDGIRNVQFVDPTNGNVAETRYFVIEPLKFRSTGDCNSNLPGAKLRSAFNGDFTSIAVQQPQSENGSHTGIVNASQSMQDTATDFVDLSGVKEGDDFSAAAQQSAGAFGPDGQLYFVQHTSKETTLMAVNPTGGQPQAVPSFDAQGFDPADETDRIFFVSNDKEPQLNTDLQQVVAPDGTWAIWAGDGWIGYGKPGTTGKKTEPNYGHTLWPFGYISQKSFYGITDDTLVRATITGSTVKEQSLLPETDGKIIDPTVSPDGTTIAFVLEKETTRALYTVPANGGQPTKVMDIDRDKLGVAILDWTTGSN